MALGYCPRCGRKRAEGKKCITCLLGKYPHLELTETDLLRMRDNIERIWREQAGGLPYKMKGLKEVYPRHPPLSKKKMALVKQKFEEYLEHARRMGKDVSTKHKRIPYWLNARRWAQATPEKNREFMRHLRSSLQKHIRYRRAMSFRERDRVKGVSSGGNR